VAETAERRASIAGAAVAASGQASSPKSSPACSRNASRTRYRSRPLECQAVRHTHYPGCRSVQGHDCSRSGGSVCGRAVGASGGQPWSLDRVRECRPGRVESPWITADQSSFLRAEHQAAGQVGDVRALTASARREGQDHHSGVGHTRGRPGICHRCVDRHRRPRLGQAPRSAARGTPPSSWLERTLTDQRCARGSRSRTTALRRRRSPRRIRPTTPDYRF
jgi:hypothetical protein